MKEVYDEAEINNAICAKMSEPPKNISLKVIPTPEQLQSLKLHTRQMEVKLKLFSCNLRIFVSSIILGTVP